MRPLLLCALSLVLACDGETPEGDTDAGGDDSGATDTADDTASGDTADTADTAAEDTDDTDDTDVDDTDSGDTDEPGVELVTAVRLLNLVSGTGPVDVYIDSATTPVVTSLAYRTPSDFMELPAGPHTLHIRTAGTPSSAPPTLSLPITLAQDRNLLAIAHPNIPEAGGTVGGPPVFTDVVDLTATPGRISARMGAIFMSESFDRTVATNDLGMWAAAKTRNGLIGEVHELPNEGGYIGLSTDYTANVFAKTIPGTFADAAVILFDGVQPGDDDLAVHSFGHGPVDSPPEEGEILALNLAYRAASGFTTHEYQVAGVGENAGSNPPQMQTNLPIAVNLTVGTAQGPVALDDGRQWIRVRSDIDAETYDFGRLDNASGTRSAYIMDGNTFFEGRLIKLPGDWIRPAPGHMRVSITGQVSYEDLTVYMTASGNGTACAGWDSVVLSDTNPVFHSRQDWEPDDLELRMEIDEVFHAFALDTLDADTLHLIGQRNATVVAVDEDGGQVIIEGTESTNPCVP